jgi:hypothetical protein
VLFVVDFLAGRQHLYEWIEHPIPARPLPLRGRLFLTDFLILLLLAILSVRS